MRLFWIRLKGKLTHLQGLDWLWLVVLLINLYSLSQAVMQQNLVSILVSSLFIFLSVRGLF